MDDNTIRFLGPIAIRLLKTDFTAQPGSSVEVPVILINQGTRPDYFELSIRGLPLEWVSIPSPVTRIEAGGQQEIRVRIAPPAETSPTGFYPMVVRAVSQEAPDQMAEVTAGLKVAAYEVTGRIGLLLDSVQFSVQPGSSVVVGLVITNHGQTAGTYLINVEGIPASWITTPSPTISLQAGSSIDVSLTIRPPRTSESRAGRHTFRVQVSNQQRPDEIAVVDGTLVIGTFNRFASELVPNQVEAGQAAQLRIENQGNTPDAFVLTWQSPNNALVFESSHPVPLRVEPGETAVVEFIARAGQQRWIGGPVPSPFTVNVESTRRESQSLSGTAITRGIVPVWVLPVFLTLCLAAACLVAWALSRNEPQQADTIATQTAAAEVAVVLTQTAEVAMSTQTASVNQTAAALAGQQDTDGDGLTDADEAQRGTSPTAADTDNDRLNDGDEVRLGTNPLNPDSDGDGLLDGVDPDPTDINNPSLTATAAVLQPTATLSPTPAPATATATTAPPTAAPATATVPAPTATTPANQPPTPAPVTGLPVTNKGVVLFASDREGNFKIYLLSTINATVARMTSGNGDDREPVLSPNGDRIAFTSNRDGNSEIYLININGTGLTNLTANPGDDHTPAWSPDGSRLLFVSDRTGNQEVFVMNADGSGATNLTNNPANDTFPAWLSSGNTTRVLFTTDRDGDQEVYAMNADGGSPTNLTQNDGNDFAPATFPNGNLIAFTSDRDGNREIYLMNLDGSDQANRTNAPNDDDQDPSWAPDGSWLAFMTDREGDLEIYVMQANGSQQGNLSTNDAEDVEPAWR